MVISLVADVLLFDSANVIVEVSGRCPSLELGGATCHFLHARHIFRIIDVEMMMSGKDGNSFLLNIDTFVD